MPAGLLATSWATSPDNPLRFLNFGSLEGAGVAFGGDEFAASNAALESEVELGVGRFALLHLNVGQAVFDNGDLGASLLVSNAGNSLDNHLRVGRMSGGLLWLGGLLDGSGCGGGFRHDDLLSWI